MFEKGDYQIDSTNERLLLSASFTAKFEVIFVLTQENAFFFEVLFLSQQEEHSFERSTCFFVKITGNLERFQYFYYETNFLEKLKPYSKNWSTVI